MSETKVRLVKGPAPIGFDGKIEPKCDLVRGTAAEMDVSVAILQAEAMLRDNAAEKGANMVVHVDYSTATAGHLYYVLVSGQGVLATERPGHGRIGFSSVTTTAAPRS